jgi:hypothetical protein
MTVEEIKQKKQSGDLKTAGKMLGISVYNAYAALNRPGSKYHERIVNVLTKLIEMREIISNEQNKTS